MTQLTIRTSLSGEVSGVAVVTLSGVVSTEDIGRLHADFHILVDKGAGFVVADLTEVTEISAAAIGELMGCRLSLVKREGELVLAGLNEELKGHFVALGVNKIFRQFKDIRSAVRFFGWEYKGQGDHFTLSFPSALSYVPAIRQFVKRIAKQKGYTDKDSFRIETIVDEICNNAVEHGSRIENAAITITVTIDSRKIEICVINTCDANRVEAVRRMVDSAAAPSAQIDQMRGRGLALVKLLSTDFAIEDSESGTCVRVTKIREE